MCVCVRARAEFVPLQLLNTIVNITKLYEHHFNAVFKILDNEFVITRLTHELVNMKLH
jgi:hypothetical protein